MNMFSHLQFSTAKLKLLVLSALFTGSLLFGTVATASAAVTSPQPAAKVSFTFDDGYESTYTKAAPVLAEFGYEGTVYVVTNDIGETNYMTWNQLKDLKNTYGWEIGSHTVTHPLLTEISDAQKDVEARESRQALIDQGFNPTAFAFPYGDYNDTVLATAAKYYSSLRGFWDIGYNVWPNNDYLLVNQQVQAGVSVAQVKSYIDSAIANNQWLILTFHGIDENPSTNPEDYEYSTQALREIAAYVKSKNIPVSSMDDGLVTGTTNLLPNGSFEAGISNGWTTDTPAVFTGNSANNGAYPNPSHSVAFNAGGANAQLFSPMTAVSATDAYVVKSFLNIQSIGGNEVAFYIDEYDANGNWVSGQYKAPVIAKGVQNVNFGYTPTAANVAKIRLQFIATGGSGATGFLDNLQLISRTNTTPETPEEPEVPNPNPNPTANIMPNGHFEAGLTTGWRTDAATKITVDASGNGSGSETTHSIKFTHDTKNAHLFAPQIAVQHQTAYKLKASLKLLQLTSGELGFYIDEYDANGNWVSGQYKQGVNRTGSSTIEMDYTPSSAQVAKASLQVIVQANSGISGYIDDVQWIAPSTTPNPEPPTEEPPVEEPPVEEPPVVVQPNLLLNADFENGFTGWTTDAATSITLDTTGNGSSQSPTNSAKLTSSTKNNHLFAARTSVDTTKSYRFEAFLKINQLTSGAVAFYIDEYDANGNWVSGQYKTEVTTTGNHNVAFTYTPSSSNVATMSIQTIVTANSGIVAYIDAFVLKLQ